MDSSSHGSDCPDRLSELPNSLLVAILSLLPTVEVVATMLLSKRWKDLWFDVPCLDFNLWHPMFDGDSYKFVMFVSDALTFSKCSSLRKLIIQFMIDDEFVTTEIADIWLRVAVAKNVEELHIFGKHALAGSEYILPVRLYSSSSIRELHLCSCKLEVEENSHWNQLKSLKLEGRESMSEETLSRVLSGAPMLEELVLFCLEIGENLNIRSTSLKALHIGTYGWSFLGTVFKSMLRIWAPNLQTLGIIGLFYGSLLLDHVPSLSKATLCFKESSDYDVSLRLPRLPPIDMFNQVFQSICSHVEELALSDLMIYFLLSMKKKDMLVRFSNVKFLNLEVCEAVTMLDVLDLFPELQMLKFQMDQDRYKELDTDASIFEVDVIEPYTPKAKFPVPSLLNLKKVDVTWYMRDASIIPAIEILLENAVVLEKLVFRPVWYGDGRELLLCTSTASPTAEVIIIKD